MSEGALKKFLNADVLGLMLVSTAIYVLLYGVEASIRGAQFRELLWICLAAAGLGFWGGKSRWNGTQASAAIVALGVIGVWILGARIARPLFDLIQAIVAAGPQIFPEINYRFDIDTGELLHAWDVIRIASAALFSRWQTWLLSANENFRVNDALISNMIWTLGLWLVSAWVGWYAAKRNALAALLPGAVLLTLLTWYSERRVEALWAFAVIMLLLMALWHYKNHTEHWDIHRIDYSDSIRYDVSQSVLAVVVVVGLAAFITPSISWRDVRDYLRDLERERARTQPAEVVSKPSSTTNVFEPSGKSVPQASLPREHLLTAGYAQSRDIVMTVKTGEPPPTVLQNVSAHAPRYYWRNAIYDQYSGAGWFTTSAPPQRLTANEPMIAGVLSGYKLLHLDVQMQQPEGRLQWSGMLYRADVPITVDWRIRPQSGLFADQSTLLQADMFAARTDAASYKADSFIPTPSIEQLRAAPMDDYPQHILARYFSLPGSVPARVHQLAGEITQGRQTPYDKAQAIETYLRMNYPYDLEINAPPEGRDVADYFLFDLKRGYCDYYATAMVVLARSSGIPARFVSGYASGEYDASNAQYIVRELHAHSWAEVYFPEIGWVEFEPTGSQPEIERETTNPPTPASDESNSITRKILFEITGLKLAVFFIPLGIVVFIVTIYFSFIEPLLLSRVAPAVAIETLYRRLYRAGRPLAGERTRAETAYEFTNKLIQRIQDVNIELRKSSHALVKDVNDLTMIYQSSLFSDHAIARQDVKMALMLWKRLRWSLVMERIKYFIWIRNKAMR